MTEEKLNKAID